MIDCLKLLALVVLILALPVWFLEGCITTRVTVVHPEIPCVITNTDLGVFDSGQIFEHTSIDCKEAEKERDEPAPATD